MSFQFTQFCAVYLFRFYGLLFVYYCGKNTEIINGIRAIIRY